MKTILVTGATGMLGSHICGHALEQGYNVFAVTRKNSANISNLSAFSENPNLRLIECDMKDYSYLDLNEKVDCFIHSAWNGLYGDARNDVKLQNENVNATFEAALLATRIGCEVFLYAGSNAEYGLVAERKRLTPYTPCNPNIAYGIAKYTAGKYAELICRDKKIRYNNIRCFQLFGRYDSPNSFMSYLVKSFQQKKRPSLTSCSQIYDIVYIKDAAQAFLKVLEKGKNGVCYVLGSGEEQTLRYYVETVRNIVNPDCEIGFGEKEYGSNQSTYLLSDISALKHDTGYTPSWSFEDGIRDLLQADVFV